MLNHQSWPKSPDTLKERLKIEDEQFAPILETMYKSGMNVEQQKAVMDAYINKVLIPKAQERGYPTTNPS
jgi:alanine dehydrogenase